MRVDSKRFLNGLDLMGLTQADVSPPRTSFTSLDAARAAVTTMQERVKKSYRAAAMNLHPDRHPEREDDFKDIGYVWDLVQKIQIGRPRPVYQSVTVVRYSGFGSSYSTTSSTSTIW